MKKIYCFAMVMVLFLDYSFVFGLGGSKSKETALTQKKYLCTDGRTVTQASECQQKDNTHLDFNFNSAGKDEDLQVNQSFSEELKSSNFSKEDFTALIDGYTGYFHVKAIIQEFIDINIRITLKIAKEDNKYTYKFYLSPIYTYNANLSINNQEYFDTSTNKQYYLAGGSLTHTEKENIIPLKYSNEALKAGGSDYRKFLSGVVLLRDFTFFKEVGGVGGERFDVSNINDPYQNDIYGYSLISTDPDFNLEKTVRDVLDEVKKLINTKFGDLYDDKMDSEAKEVINALFGHYVVPIFNIKQKYIGFDKKDPNKIFITTPLDNIKNTKIFSIILNKDIKYHLLLVHDKLRNSWIKSGRKLD